MLTVFEEVLKQADAQLAAAETVDVPAIFASVPLGVFGDLTLGVPSKYPHIKAFLPKMPSEQVQTDWTGTHGEALLRQSLVFFRTMTFGYAALAGRRIGDASVLDFGCGWGRIMRLLYKFVPIQNIYGVDPWDQSIDLCRQYGVKGSLALSDWVPRSLPFQRQFDLIFAFSVFTHLSEKTTRVALDTLRKYLAPEGVLVITIRPKEYWQVHDGGSLASTMMGVHEENMFAFQPHNRPPIDGDITYGDCSFSLPYFTTNFPEWMLESVEYNSEDPYQLVLFLKAA